MMGMMKRKIVTSFFWKFFERCSSQLVSFIVTIVLARLLLPEDYGVVALISVFMSLAEVIADGGFNMALIQKKNADNIDFSTIFYFTIAVSVALYCALFFLSPFIATFYNLPDLVPIVRVMSLSLLFFAFTSVPKAYIARNFLFKQFFYCNIIAIILSGVAGIVCAKNGLGPWALVAQMLLKQVFLAAAMWIVIQWRPSYVFSISRFKVLFNFGWKIFATNFIVTLFLRIRLLVIGKFFDTATLAEYEKGDQMPSLLMDNLCGSIQSVIFPAFSEIQDDIEKIKSLMRKSIDVSCLFVFPVMVGLIVGAEPLVRMLLTEKWIGIVPYMQVLCIANFFRPITIPNQQAITALGYSNITLRLEIIRKFVDITILVVSVHLGALAIAWGDVLFNLICLFINLHPNVKLLNYGIGEQILDVLPNACVALFMGVCIWWINLMPWLPVFKVLAMFLMGAGVYCLICRILKLNGFMFVLNIIKKHREEI